MKQVIIIILLLILYATSESFDVKSHETEWTAQAESGCVLKGTLINVGKDTPIALIISGSGPTDRDGNSLMTKNNSLKQLAEALAEKGISSLRYDKRGVGASTQQCETSENELRIETYAEDAVIMLEGIRATGNFSKIYIIGHSEGSLLGLMVAERSRLDGFISLSGSGKPAHELLKDQLSKQLAEPMLTAAKASLDTLAMGDTLTYSDPMLAQLFRPSVQPYLISWFAIDPTEKISAIGIPVMVVGGGNDIQVDEEQSALLAKAAQIKPVIFPKMTHTLKEAEKTTKANMATYSDPNIPLQEGLAAILASFIKSPKD